VLGPPRLPKGETMNRMKMSKGERHESPKTVHHVEVKEAEGGGHIVTHHFNNGGMGTYHNSEEHVFSAAEGSEALAHIASAANIKGSEPSESEGEETGENEEA
jgi:hypothetical protein